MHFTRLIGFVVISLVACACSTYYYGYSRQEWAAMSERERALAKVAYYEILAEQEKMKREDPQEKAYEDFKDRAIRTPGSGNHSLPDAI